MKVLFMALTALVFGLGISRVGFASSEAVAMQNHIEGSVREQNAVSCEAGAANVCFGSGYARHHYASAEGARDAARVAGAEACKAAVQRCVSMGQGTNCVADYENVTRKSAPDFPQVLVGAVCFARPYHGPVVNPD